jgi:hypothetical protein
MKTMARPLVWFHFKAELNPVIEEGHNSDQRDGVVAGNVKKLINDSLFLQGPPDANVSFALRDDQPR